MKFFSIMIALLLVAGTAQSAEDIRPADFDHAESKRRLAERIEFPEMTRDASVIIQCNL